MHFVRERGCQTRRKKGSDIGGAKWLNAKSSGVKLRDWKYFALLFFYSESWKPRFAFDSFAGIRVNQQMETFSLNITCSFRNSGVLFPTRCVSMWRKSAVFYL